MADDELPLDLFDADIPDVYYSTVEPRMHYIDFGFHEEETLPSASEEEEPEVESSDEFEPRVLRAVRTKTKKVRVHSGEVLDYLGPMSERKSLLKGMDWEEFQMSFKCTEPLQFPDNSVKYHPNIFLSDEKYRTMGQTYRNYTEQAFGYYCRDRGRYTDASKTGTCLALNNQMTEMAWKLFVGLDAEQVAEYLDREDISKIYHRDVELLLAKLRLHSSDPDFVSRRKQFRMDYVGDKKLRIFDLNGVVWVVTQHRDLPWMIPIENFHFHNANALNWRKATLYEMILCGRLIEANDRLYKDTELYKKLFPLILHMNKHLVHKKDTVEKWEMDVWDNWHAGDEFFWYSPCFRVCLVPSPAVRHCMMLAFKKSTTRRSGNLIVVPAYSLIYAFAGEVRPVDLSVDDIYAFDLIHNRGEKYMATISRSKKSLRPELVCTNYVLYDNRPGVGSAAYMANHTCGMGETVDIKKPKLLRPNEYFYMSEIKVGNREGNAIANADLLTVFTSLKSTRDITSKVVTHWTDNNAKWLSVTLGPSMVKEYDFFPVEFIYNRDVPEEKGTKCMCLTRCNRHKNKTNILISSVSNLTARPSRTSTEVLREEINRFIPDVEEHAVKRGYIRDYLAKQGLDHTAALVV